MKKSKFFGLGVTALALGVVAGAIGAQKATEVKAVSNKTFGFLNTSDWEAVKAHYWVEDGASTTWPGVDTTDTGKTESGHKIYSVSVDVDTYNKIIFNNNDQGSQTANLDIPAKENSVYDLENTGWAVPHTWGIVGRIGGVTQWNKDFATSAPTNPIAGTSATLSYHLSVGDKFKFRADEDWALDVCPVLWDVENGDYVNTTYFDVDGTNAVVKDGFAGTYNFTINWRIENYGKRAYGVDVSFVPDFEIRGNGSAFGDGDFAAEDAISMVYNSGTEVKKLNLTLGKGDKFKFVGNGNWYGYEELDDASELYGCFDKDESNNIVVQTAGTYNFYLKTDKLGNDDGYAVWVTSDDYTAICTWAEDFADAEDLCNGEGDEWTKYETSYAALSSGAKAFFAADRATAIDGKEHPEAHAISKAAYRYEYGVAVKGQAAFAETERPKTGYQDKYSTALSLFSVERKNNLPVIITVTVSLGAIAAAAGFVFLRKRKNNA